MNIKYFQKGFNYSQDGPGNRLVYHLHGCNMRCPWCSNPEGMEINKVYPAFPVTEVSVDTLFNEIMSCVPMFFDGGGVTFTGGEVTLQWQPLKVLLEKLKSKGINTAIETNAILPSFCELLPYLDHLIMDVKSADEEKLFKVTGGHLEPIIKNLSHAVSLGVDTLVHVPLIGGFNDSDEDVEKLLNVLSPFKDKIKIEFLSYHEYGKDKWKKCGLEYEMKDAHISKETYKEIVNKFKAVEFTVIRT